MSNNIKKEQFVRRNIHITSIDPIQKASSSRDSIQAREEWQLVRVKFSSGVASNPTFDNRWFYKLGLPQLCCFWAMLQPTLSNHITTYATFMGCLINAPRECERVLWKRSACSMGRIQAHLLWHSMVIHVSLSCPHTPNIHQIQAFLSIYAYIVLPKNPKIKKSQPTQCYKQDKKAWNLVFGLMASVRS